MVDPVFKAPTPPQMTPPPAAPEPTAVPTESVQEPVVPVAPVDTTSTNDGTVAPSKKQQIMDRLDELKAKMIRYFWYSVVGLFLLGAFFGCAMSGSDAPAQQTQTVSGISARVISNKDKKSRLPICGSVMPSQPCLFFVLNNTSYDKVADDFFRDVAAATQRTEFNLRRDNPLYGKTVIKPGYFAEIIVPGV